MILIAVSGRARSRPTALLALLLTLAAWQGAPGAVAAQDTGQGQGVTQKAPACPPAEAFANVRVERVTRMGATSDASTRNYVELRDDLALQVTSLGTLLDRQRCLPQNKKIVLYLDGRPIPTLEPFPPVDPATNTLRFVLRRDEGSRDAWAHLLGRPTFSDRPVAISVGIIDEFPIRSDQTIRLRAIPRGWFWVWTTLLVLLAIAFLALAKKSNLLRDVGPEPGGNDRKPYSLAKMQAAWWFFLVLTAYLFIGLVAGDYSTSITGTVLVLMGISAATAVGSATIDAGAASATGNTKTAQTPAKSRKWWLDILSDENGVNFHRFQMAVWTAVLGLIFVHEVFVELAMPTFDNTLLGLMGISAGTYLGLKTTSEKDK